MENKESLKEYMLKGVGDNPCRCGFTVKRDQVSGWDCLYPIVSFLVPRCIFFVAGKAI